MTRALLLLVTVWAGAAAAQEIVTPSGLAIQPIDRIVELQGDGETWLTLRYLAPAIGGEEGDLGYDQVADDIDWLCDAYGLAAARDAGAIDQVIIAIMDRVVERGVFDPQATAFIGAYLPTEGGCVWQ